MKSREDHLAPAPTIRPASHAMGGTAVTDSVMERRYRLVELQREELRVQMKIDDSSHWRDASQDNQGYLAKESLRRASVQSKRGSIFLALVVRTPARVNGDFGHDSDVGDEDLVPGETLILCHCESHAFDCAIRSLDGELTRGLSRTVSSVYMLPEYRRQGLGSFFLKSVKDRMATFPDAISTMLYSEIGSTFYEKLGWQLHESTEATLDVSKPLNAAVDNNQTTLTRLYHDQDLDELLKRDNARVLSEMASAKYTNKEVFALLPSRESATWRELILSFRGVSSPPTQTGVYIDDDAFLLWSPHLKESTLFIVHARLPADRPMVVVQLLRVAIVAARKFSLRAVVTWNPIDAVFSPEVTNELEVTKQFREDSLSLLAVFRKKAGDETLPMWLNDVPQAWV